MPHAIRPQHVPNRVTRSPLHLVQSAHAEAPSGRQPVHPLHLPQMHLPAHDEVGTEASDTGSMILAQTPGLVVLFPVNRT